MKSNTWILFLALASLAILPQRAVAGQFKKPIYYSAPGLPWAVVTADFNHDKNLDLAVADFGNQVVQTLLGKGDGSFRKGPSFPIAAPYAPDALAVGDFDQDGNSDLAVVEYNGTSTGKLGIFLGNGDGTFRQAAEYQLGIEPNSAAIADFDGDGHLDIAVTNELGFGSDGSVMVFFGNGDGTFKTPVVYKLANQPYGLTAGDLNGDHHADLVVTEVGGSGAVAILMNTGGGRFSKARIYTVLGEPTNAAIADLNHDGNPDLVVTASESVAVLLGKGGGKLRKAVYYSTRSITQEADPYAVVVADFNRDGNLDIATVLFQGNSGLFYGKGDGTFKPVVTIKLRVGGGTGIATGDFRKDTSPDLVIINKNTSQVAVLVNSTD